MFTLRQALVEHQERIARLITQDMGKTLPDAYAEVGRAIEMVECAAAVPTTMQGRNLENVATNIDTETYRQPIGVFGAICPFNFPAMVPMWFLPFAVACGNTFVLKPSEQVPLAQEAIFQLIHDLELLPPGVVNLVNGGREVVEGICDHPGIAGVSFVGSATVAKLVYERAARAGKRVQALGGAKNHIVVMPDAVVDKTVDGIIGSAFGAAGQRCMAGSVLVTVGSAHDAILPPLIEAAKRLRVGNGLEQGVGVGPLVSCERRDIVRSWIDKGAAEGASIALDGREEGGDHDGGAFVGPTILDGVTPDMEVAREEIFGPVLSVVQVDTLDEAIEVVNASRYGNGSSIFTESGAAARRYRHDCDAGMIGVNVGVAAPVAFFPFSGWKDSFLGDLHAHGGDAIDFFTRKTTVTSRWYSDGETGRFFVE
jgi:malonate-semialdehyde dehydrogenase (acetylating)/methylmalonate-semialdehyde dehydrogenase